MKGQLLILIALVSLLSTLVSCGSGSQSEAKLEVSKAFAMTNPYFGGGLMIHGSSSTGQQFTIALDSNLERTLKLENGLWTFLAIGWDGGAGAPVKFGGLNQCGIITKDISASTVVDISMNTSNCSLAAFKDAVKLNQFRALTCGTFSDYNPGTNTYSPVTAATPDSYCQNLPMELRSELSHFKIVAMENINGVVAQGFQSSCYHSGTVIGSLPSRRFPFLIKAYRSLEECNANALKHQSFGFLKGLEAGNPEKFDHLLQYQGVSPEYTRLLLPSSISRRGTSLFTQMIPRVLCGASPSLTDCFKSPVTDAHVGVEWFDNNSFDRKLLYKGPNATCSGLVANIGKNFNFKDCQVEDGNVRAHVSRNELLCQEVGDPNFSGAIDMYSSNNKLYILFPNLVRVYDEKGNFLTSVGLPNSGYNSITVTNGGTIYVSWSMYVEKFTESSPNMYSQTFTYTLPVGIHDIDFDETYGALYFSGTDGFLYSLDVNTSTILQTSPYLGTIDKMKISGTSLFIKNGSNIQKHSLTGFGIFNNTPAIYLTLTNPTNLTIESGNLHVTHNSGDISIYDFNLTHIKTNITPITTPNALAVMGDKAYIYGSGQLKAFSYAPVTNTLSLISTHTGTCSEAIDLSPFGMSKIITVKSSTEDLIPIFAEALDILGLRVVANLDHPYYIFRPLHEDDNDIKTGGGRLRRVQESLSSTGILSLIKTHATCIDLKNAVAAGPITPAYSVFDPFEGELFKVNFKISSGAEVIPSYICSATSSAGCGTAAGYDLRIEFAVSDSLGINEKGIFKLACNRALGSYETFDNRDIGEKERELILWNTENPVASRFEEYILEVESNEIWAGLNKFEKVNNSEFWSRSANVGIDTTGAYGSVGQLQLAGGNISTRRDGYSGVDLSALFISAGAASTNTSFTGSAPKCMSSGNNLVYTSNNIGCNFTLVPAATSKGLNLNLDTFSDLDNATPGIRSIFTISDF